MRFPTSLRASRPSTESTTTEPSSLLIDAATTDATGVLTLLRSRPTGLTATESSSRLAAHGFNVVQHARDASAITRYLRTFTNPFILILLFLFTIMFVTDIVLAPEDEGPDVKGVITVGIMVLVSTTLRFYQESRSNRAVGRLRAMVRNTARVLRTDAQGEAHSVEVPSADLVPGDIVQLTTGDLLPADVRIIETRGMALDQSPLTGESLPSEKTSAAQPDARGVDPESLANVGFMGTSVQSGSGTAVVIATGADTAFGALAAAIAEKKPPTAFDTGLRKISMTLIGYMCIMVPTVVIINSFTSGWLSALLFGVTVAVGLTPEMLPLIVTANLARGAQAMAKEEVIVKDLSSIQNLGAMDVLATDKTGTLTQDRITVERAYSTSAATEQEVLRLAATNAYFQTAMDSALDAAILDAAADLTEDIRDHNSYVHELPFDFERRMVSVVIESSVGLVLIAKGATDEILSRCSNADDTARALVAEQNTAGHRVIAVARKRLAPEFSAEVTDLEDNLELVGFLVFRDPPKESARDAVAALNAEGIAVKIITGDDPRVAANVALAVGIPADRVATGAEIDRIDDAALRELAEQVSIFAKVSPIQKSRIVTAMRSEGHTVGFLGDGINDAPVLRVADVGITVDSASAIARDTADILLLRQDLSVLARGVRTGRRTFVNTMKYITMTASSNFGNMFSVLVASAFLPFLPMIPLVVLVQNLAYDLSMLTLPWDRVDEEEIAKPRRWDTRVLSQFMLRIGPLSSIFDITTFALMWYVFGANSPENAALFQSGWFVESLLSQTIIVHVLRTRRIPFFQSMAGRGVLIATLLVCVMGISLPFTPMGAALGLVALPLSYFPWLVLTLLAYMLVAQLSKRAFVRRFNSWV